MTRNRLKNKFLFALLCLAFANITLASTKVGPLTLSPYIGVDYQYEHIKPHRGCSDLFVANYNNVAVFAGTKFNKNIGVEIGYFHWVTIGQQQYTPASFNGEPVDTGGVAATIANMAFKGFSIDVDLYYPLDPNFNVYVLFGLATMHPHFSFTSLNSSDLDQAFSLLQGQNRTVPRLGGGMEYVEKNWGARARLIWDYTQDMTLNVSAAQQQFPQIYGNVFLQGILFTCGIFYIF